MRSNKTSYVFVTGGVLSGIGKGITAASLGALFNCAGLKVTAQKMDPYLNVDPGTMNPAEHGEVFVTEDGVETDLDLGHYERFIGTNLNINSTVVSGSLFTELLKREREGKYLGKTVQLVPHLTNLIQEKIIEASKDSDIHIVEIGGTIGDYEALSFVEAVRIFSEKVGRENCLFVHVAFVPFLEVSKEFKTKPLQNSVRDLRNFGLTADIIIARTEKDPNEKESEYIEKKIALFCGVPENQVVVMPNADTIYRVPVLLQSKGIAEIALNKFKLKYNKPAFAKAMAGKWKEVLKVFEKAHDEKVPKVRIGIVAKYLHNADSYYSVIESLRIASWYAGVKMKYDWVSAEELEGKNSKIKLEDYDGILVPGGFGNRGVEGKILAAQTALTKNIPYLGLCLGLQVATIGAARLGGLKNGNSEEFVKNNENIIYIMEDQKGKVGTGGTMRLGTYKCHITKGSLAEKVFGKKEIDERHRHRFEVNRKFEEFYSKGGVKVSGTSKDGKLVELVEATDPKHPFFLATQSHPEFLTRPWKPHPMFLEFLKACRKSSVSRL